MTFLAELIMVVVCFFKKHNFLALGNYNYCARCGHLEVRPNGKERTTRV